LIDELTGQRLELHEEGGTIIQYGIAGDCIGDYQKTFGASSGQAGLAQILVRDGKPSNWYTFHIGESAIDKQVVSRSSSLPYIRQRDYTVTFEFNPEDRSFKYDEWFIVDDKQPPQSAGNNIGTFHRVRMILDYVGEYPSTGSIATGEQPQHFFYRNLNCPGNELAPVSLSNPIPRNRRK
jgi:hypothetical protein